MVEFFILTILTALASAFLIILMKKWSVLEWLQAHATDLIAKWASCDFCCGFWLAVIIACAISFSTNEYRCLFIPIFSAPLTRMLV